MGVKYIGTNDFDPAYFTVSKGFNSDIPDMPLSLYSSGIDLEALPGTSVGACLIKPYFNRHWDGERAFNYTPPDKVTGKPALTINGKVATSAIGFFQHTTRRQMLNCEPY